MNKTSCFVPPSLRLHRFLATGLGLLLGLMPCGLLLAWPDNSNMSDATFFGVYNGSTWTTPSKLNFSYAGGANWTAVKTAVQNANGNYTNAKAALLHYFRNRTAPVHFYNYDVPSVDRNTLKADITLSNIFSIGSDKYRATVIVNGTNATVQANVTGDIQAVAAASNKVVAFMLFAKDKSTDYAVFNSSEAAANRPTLSVTDASGTHDYIAVEDTFIKADGSGPYGGGATLEVRDGGSGASANAIPTDATTRRTYLKFDLSSGIVGTVTNAVLKLYGRNASSSASKSILVYRSGETAWTEATCVWNSIYHTTYSWNGLSGGCNWRQPASHASASYIPIVVRYPFNELAAEYVATGNLAYSDKLMDIMTDFIWDIDQYGLDVKDYDGDNQFAIVPQENAIRAESWMRFIQALRNSSSLDANGFASIMKSLQKTLEFLSTPAGYTTPEGNWSITQNGDLLMGIVYLPEFMYAQSAWWTTGLSRLDSQINTTVKPDGSYVEASTSYTGAGLGGFMNIKKQGVANGVTFGANFETKLRALAKYQMDTAMPNGFDPGIGDGGTGDMKNGILGNGNIFGDQSMIYVGSAGTSGTMPNYLSQLYPHQKMAIMRTGWQSNDLYLNLSQNNYPVQGQGHVQHDENSLVAYAFGRRLLVDPGRNSYAGDDAISLWEISAEAHNTIQVDNGDMDQTAPGKTYFWTTNPYYDFAVGYTEAWAGRPFWRKVLFLKPDFWIVSDLLTSGSGSHTYKQTWHYEPSANPTIDATTRKSKTNHATGPNIQVVPADPSAFTAATAFIDNTNAWYSENFYNVAPSPFSSYSKTVTGNVTFDTVLYPTPQGDNRDVRVTRLTTNPSVATTTATALKIDLAYNTGNKGYYYCSHEGSFGTRSFDIYNYNGMVAYVETDNAGNRMSALMKTGRVLKENGTDLINSPALVNDLAVEWNGATLDLYSSDLTPSTDTTKAIAIYAPGATTVRLNGVAINATTSGNYKYAATSIYSKIRAENYNSMTGIKLEPAADGPVNSGQSVTYIENNDTITFTGVNLSGVTGFEARVASAGVGGMIEVRLGSASGTLLGTCSVSPTGGWNTWTTRTTALSGATGTNQTVCLKFTGAAGYLFNLNWFRFTP